MLEAVTPLILTFNEAPNIERTLRPLQWAHQILVIDSGSSDGTLEILDRYPNVRVVRRNFDSFAGQCNFGLDQVRTPWVLSLDADYILTDAICSELRALEPTEEVSGFRAAFVYCIYGKSLRGTLYPPRVVLYRKGRAHYCDEGHGHRVQIDGEVLPLKSPIFHDDHKPLCRWFDSQRAYARREAEHLATRDPKELGWSDWLRTWICPAPPAAFLYTLFVKRCILDGWPGWFYAMQRTYFEVLLSLELLDRRLRRAGCENDVSSNFEP